jgi:hypothetical protein
MVKKGFRVFGPLQRFTGLKKWWGRGDFKAKENILFGDELAV